MRLRFASSASVVLFVLLLTATLGAAAPAAAATANAGAIAAPANPAPPAGPPGSADELLALLAVQQAQLTAGDGGGGDNFGWSVAVSGDTAVVGAYFDDVGANDRQGSAYVFTRSGTTWSQQQKLAAADGAANDEFGWSVAIAGNTVVVGALESDVGANFSQGAAYVFVRSGTAWSQQQKLTAADGAASDLFGWSVALSGDTAVVSAEYDTVGANAYQGSAYVFVRSGTTWSQQQKLTAADGAANDYFGCSVALSGGTAVVGAHNDDVGANTDQGSAYVFTRSGTTWNQQAHLTAADGAANDWFGNSVAISGETAVVGAPKDVVGANTDQGSAYVFARSGTTWSQQQKLTAGDGAAWSSFGHSVAISGDTALVGAFYDDVGANTDQGSAYVFAVKPGRPTAKSPKGLISSRTPTFKWTTAALAASYEVRIYKGSKLIRKKTGITKTAWKCTRRLPRGVRLTWKVRAHNAAGWGPWSNRPRFKVR